MRLDEYVFKHGFSSSIEKARDFILAGSVLVNNATVRSKIYKVRETDSITLSENAVHVSRGYNKLDAAIKEFSLSVAGEVCLDIGASTGGFSECLLNYNAKKVYALDVGHNQLVYKLRKDSRIVSIENTNAKEINRLMFGDDVPSILVSDVSFISITKIAPIIRKELPDIKFWLSLIKPQFEANYNEVETGGIIRNDELRETIVKRTIDKVCGFGFSIENKMRSPIKGQKGNIEYLTLFKIDNN